MFSRRKKRTEPSRSDLLAAVPIRHPAASEQAQDSGALLLAVPLPRSRAARWLTLGNNRPVIRKFELDERGAEVWRMIDGRTTVRALIESLAEQHRLNLREAEVAMLSYLRTLLSRGIVLLQSPTGSVEINK
jgi:hypothetical protein